jgi:hypothetical protein
MTMPLTRRASLLALALSYAAFGQTATVTQTVNVQLGPAGKLSVPASMSLVGGGAFAPFLGSLIVNYRARTRPISGSAAITLQATEEFSPSGGPAISAGVLTYTCGAAQLGTACTGTQVMSTTLQRKVVDIPAGVCMGGGAPCVSVDPASIPVQFSLDNNPGYDPGSYTTRLLFTISSL